jgi:YD repeat-containing protein
MGAKMQIAGRRLVLCLLLCSLGLGCWCDAAAVASTGVAASAGALGDGLVVPDMQPLVGGQQIRAQGEALRDNPGAVVARVLSRTSFEELDASQAARAVAEAFPGLLGQLEGGVPQLPSGARVTGFVNPGVAQVDLGGNKHAVIESPAPMAKRDGDRWVPLDLALSRSRAGFAAADALVNVLIPTQIGEGVQLPAAGISVTPVTEKNVAVAGAEGVSEGASVLFANTQTDSDTVVKPSTLGVDLSTILRSVRSPERIAFRVALPQGARLVRTRAGAVRVIKSGTTLGVFPAPHATDAAGTLVPVGMSISGDMLVLSVAHSAASYLYPILVDPEFDETTEPLAAGNWHFTQAGGYTSDAYEEGLWMEHTGSFSSGDYGRWQTQTQGYTSIYALEVSSASMFPSTEGVNGREYYSWQNGYFEIKGEHEAEELSLLHAGDEHLRLCANVACSPEGVSHNNAAALELTTLQSGSTSFNGEARHPVLYISQEASKHSEVKAETASQYIEFKSEGQQVKLANIFHLTQTWLSPTSGAIEYTASDGGLGVEESGVEVYNTKEGEWEKFWWGSENYLKSKSCIGIQCVETELPRILTYENLRGDGGGYLPPGSDRIRLAARSAMPGSEAAEAEHTIKVDGTAPEHLTLNGLTSVKKKHEVDGVITETTAYQLGEVEAHIRAQATDGESGIESSGVKSITLAIDGREFGTSHGYCSPGPCTGTSEWAINGAELGAGTHTLTVVATDNAGNYKKETYELEVYHASPVAAGPGSVNPESGDFAMEATDVNLSGGMGSLTVSRHYDSRNVAEGAEGPLGPQWSIGLGGLAKLEVLPDESVMVIGPEGLTHFNKKEGGGFEAPEGDANLTLEYEPNGPSYIVADPKQGTVTEFTLPKGAAAWLPTVSKGPVATDKMTDEYKSVEVAQGQVIVEPTLELAPHPDATCGHEQLEKLEIAAKGCRALEFVYDEGETTAKGEAETEWGSYKHRLKEVLAIAYNPATKAMARVPVAAYEYDKQGRLRAEWNPEITPALRTTYGYDGEGHITAVVPPGQQPWLLHYGTSASDLSKGRLLSVIRPSASTVLHEESYKDRAPVIKSQETWPEISSPTPLVGVQLSVSEGGWEYGPLSYGYQWERCSSAGLECAEIAGATNKTYTPVTADVGHKLRARVSAINQGGATTSSSLASAVVSAGGPPAYSASFGSSGSGAGQVSAPAGVAVAPGGYVWVADTSNNRIEKFSSSGTFLEAFGWGVSNGKEEAETCTSSCKAGLPGAGTGQFDAPKGIVLNQSSEIYVSNQSSNKIQHLSSQGVPLTPFGASGSGNGDLSEPHGLAVDAAGDVWVADTGNSRVEEFSASGGYLKVFGSHGTKLGQFDGPAGVAFSGESLYITDPETNRVEQLKPSTSEWVREFGTSGSETEKLSAPTGIAQDPLNGYLYIASSGSGRVQGFKAEGKYIEGFGHAGSEPEDLGAPQGIGINPTTGALYIADQSNSRVDIWVPRELLEEPTQPPPNAGTTAVTTIEYEVPISAPGPWPMTKGEVEKWGQKDIPWTATAIFPATEPMGWPAADYTRATTEYLDSEARTVNVANPAGGITTTEYNEDNEVTRTLTADNRVVALKEPKPAEAAELLDTKSTYNNEGQLTETLGPQHPVKLAVGKEGKIGEEVLARNHVTYTYNEGASAGEQQNHETYNLVTRTVDAAQVANKEEFDKRTVRDLYSGQNYLGWKLRKPTSVITETAAGNLTTTTKYEGATGNVEETQTPAAAGGDKTVPPAYISQFGAKGTNAGQLEQPTYDAIDAHGDVWVTEDSDNRLSEFSETGTFIETVGWGVSNGEAKLEVCTSGCKAGIAGTGKGQFNSPTGIAIASGDIYVVDSGNDRIEVLSEKGEWVNQWGSAGAEAGQFKTPLAIAISPAGDVWVGDSLNRRLQEFTSSGTFIEALGWEVISKGKAEYEVCKSSCQAGLKGNGVGQFVSIWGLAFAGTNLYAVDTGNDRVQEINEKSENVRQFGTAGTGNLQFTSPIGISVSPTTGNLYVTDTGNNRVQELTPNGVYVAQFGTAGSSSGQLDFPEGSATSSSGEIYLVDDLNHRVARWVPTITGNEGAHDTKTYYYTAKNEAETAACKEHIEWAGLPCETTPVDQPGGEPQLPVTKITYNLWDQPETITETFGAVERMKKTEFDKAGRPVVTEETSSADTAFPEVTDKYNKENGSIETQTTSKTGELTKTLTTLYNSLGRLTTYKDADENTATFEYEKEKAGRLTKVSDNKGTQTYFYNETTGALDELTTSAIGTFTSSQDVEGKTTSEKYPNGIVSSYVYNSVGTATSLEYEKTTHCTGGKEKCVWFKDSVTPSIHGETMKQTSTLAEEPSYTYDAAGRLTEVQEIPAGQGCKVRAYTYDEDSNRTTETTREPGTEGKCATEGGATEWHTYNTADALTDPGVKYDAFGNTTNLPAPDAGGTALETSYYVDNQVAKQTQGEHTSEYKVDPEGRTAETVAGGKTTTCHYDAPGAAVAWYGEGSEPNEKWTRDIPGIDGTLAATQKGEGTIAGEAVLLLHDLQGNVVATVEDSETATGLVTKYESTEFGVPSTKEAPPRYAWLGADGVTSELATGVITQDGVTYVPQAGRVLQTQPVEVPQPVNAGTAYVSTVSQWVIQAGIESSARHVALFEEQQRTIADAGWPSGDAPAPQCNIETEGCASDPEHGTNVFRCEFHAAWSIDIELDVQFACSNTRLTAPTVEIQVEIWRVEGGKYHEVYLNKKPKSFSDYHGEFVARLEECDVGKWYRGWVYGSTWLRRSFKMTVGVASRGLSRRV